MFEEDGTYSFWISPVIREGETINEPLIPAYIYYSGSYSITSNSQLWQCVDSTASYRLEPHRCDHISYSINDGTFTLEVGEFAIGHREYDTLSEVRFSRHSLESTVAGTWEGRHFSIARDAVWTLGEGGEYSERSADITEPLSLGTYSSISDSMLQICLTRDLFISGNELNPPVCYNTPYLVLDNTLILGPARVRFEEGAKYLPEYSLLRQMEN